MLRSYQETQLNEAKRLMASGIRSVLLQAPTGSGKTVLSAHLVKGCASKDNRVWFLTHRRELIKQVFTTFTNVGINCGIVSSGWMPEPIFNVQICSIPSLGRRIESLPKPKLIIWDECHHVAATNWTKIHKLNPDAFHIGLTATPERLDGKGLAGFFQKMVKGPSVEWLISNGFLSRYKLFVPSTVDMSNVKKTMGDFNKKQVRNIVDKPTITGSAIEEYKKLGGRKKTVVFAASIEHSKHIVEQFISSGINAVHLDGETETKLRDETMQSFKEGKIDVISNVDLFGEGFDCPTIEVAILLRPTASTALYLQQVGRALRPSPGKQWAYILDHVGNCQRHGLPDEFRDWSLEGHSSKRTKSDSTVRVKICPKCFAAQGPGTSCKYCGYFFPINTRLQDIKQEKGELQEVDLEKIKKSRKAEQSQAQTVNDLIVIAKNRGYNNPSAWAYHVYRARMKRYA